MIKDIKENAGLYKGLNKNLDKVFELIEKKDFGIIATGKYQVEGEEVYFIKTEYETRDEEDCFFEAHKKYIDVHFCLEGKETMAVENFKNMHIEKDYDEKGDCFILGGQACNKLELSNGTFMVFFPEDAHMTGIGKASSSIKKIIFKALMEE